jgi:hypothetical protein
VWPRASGPCGFHSSSAVYGTPNRRSPCYRLGGPFEPLT